MNFAICNEIFKDWKLEDIFSYAAKIGYDAVEIAPFTIADSVLTIPETQRREIRAAAARSGIAIAGLHWLLVKPEGLYLTDVRIQMRMKTGEYLCALVDFCADVGGKVMVLGSPKQRNLQPGVSPEAGRTWAINTLREPVRRAEDRGVTICLEPLSPAETNFINTAAEAIAFTQQLPSPNFKIILDVKAMCSEGKPIPQIIRESWPHFAHFHANDKNLKGPGFGEVDFKPIAAALKEVGYGGFVSVEVFNFDEGPEVIASRSLEYLRKTFS